MAPGKPGIPDHASRLSEKITKESHGDYETDAHGQVLLSRADHDFIREKAEAAGTIHVTGGGLPVLRHRTVAGNQETAWVPPGSFSR